MGTNASSNRQHVLQVNRSILSAVKLLASENIHGVTIKYRSPDHIHYIRAEEQPFFVVLQGILGYAIKLAGKDGKMSISHRLMKGRRHNDRSDLVRFCIRVIGRGISEEMFTAVNNELQRIGDALTKDSLSLDKFDLAASRAYFREAGGNVWITSKLNNGIQIYFTYPLLRELNLDEIKKPVIKVVKTLFPSEKRLVY